MGSTLTIRAVTRGDAAAVAEIYGHYVRNSAITFELEAPDTREMAARIDHILLRYPFLVAEQGETVVGYAHAGKLYERPAYRWSAEATVYVAPDQNRRGIGRELYHMLIASLAEQGFQAVFGKITLPNPASVRLHESLGFVRCGLLAGVGFKNGAWHDVGLFQLELGTRPSRPRETRPFA